MLTQTEIIVVVYQQGTPYFTPDSTPNTFVHAVSMLPPYALYLVTDSVCVCVCVFVCVVNLTNNATYTCKTC